jgi:hypothetical protein
MNAMTTTRIASTTLAIMAFYLLRFRTILIIGSMAVCLMCRLVGKFLTIYAGNGGRVFTRPSPSLRRSVSMGGISATFLDHIPRRYREWELFHSYSKLMSRHFMILDPSTEVILMHPRTFRRDVSAAQMARPPRPKNEFMFVGSVSLASKS